MHISLKSWFDQIEDRKSALLKNLDLVEDTRLHQSEGEGKWSVAQVIRHLAVAEEMSVRYCQKKIHAGSELPKSGLAEGIKSGALNLFLSTSIKYKAPISTLNPEDEVVYQDACLHWYNARESLRKFLNEYPEKYLNKAIYKHPIIGRVNLLSMLKFFDAHIRHHEHQIKRILKATAS